MLAPVDKEPSPTFELLVGGMRKSVGPHGHLHEVELATVEPAVRVSKSECPRTHSLHFPTTQFYAGLQALKRLEVMLDPLIGDNHSRFVVHVYLSLIHISEPTRLGMISYAVFCLKKKK